MDMHNNVKPLSTEHSDLFKRRFYRRELALYYQNKFSESFGGKCATENVRRQSRKISADCVVFNFAFLSAFLQIKQML